MMLKHDAEVGFVGATAEAFASQGETDSNAVIYDYDAEYCERKYELLSLKIIHRRRRTGFEETKDFPIRVNDLVAGRYQASTFACCSCYAELYDCSRLSLGTEALWCLAMWHFLFWQHLVMAFLCCHIYIESKQASFWRQLLQCTSDMWSLEPLCMTPIATGLEMLQNFPIRNNLHGLVRLKGWSV